MFAKNKIEKTSITLGCLIVKVGAAPHTVQRKLNELGPNRCVAL